MITDGEDDLICDFAEYYHIYDIYSLPPIYLATLACGLRNDSRCKSKLLGVSGFRDSVEERILALIFDAVNWLKWANTEDGAKNINHPKSLFNAVFGEKDDSEPEYKEFNSGEDFDRKWKEIINHANNS